MKYLKGILATTHIDLQNEKISLSAIESLVEQSNNNYIPVDVEHDPRKPPIGRLKSTRLQKMEDGEYSIEGISEIFENEEDIKLDTESTREIIIKRHNFGNLDIAYDINYRNPSDQELIGELNNLINSEIEPLYKCKKSL